MYGIQFQIQLKNIDTRLAKDTELSAQSVFGDEGANFRCVHATLPCDARNLKVGRGGRNVRIQSGA
jgi:hypothetical protein